MRNVQSTLLYKWFDEVWNKDDINAIDRLFADGTEAKGLLTDDQPKGAAGFKIFFKQFRNQFHNVNISVDDAIAQDDIEAARTTVTAIHTATGKPVTFPGMCMVKVANGQIVEAHNNYDFTSMEQQTGAKMA
jgi:ketosteroid isomerase-like protein